MHARRWRRLGLIVMLWLLVTSVGCSGCGDDTAGGEGGVGGGDGGEVGDVAPRDVEDAALDVSPDVDRDADAEPGCEAVECGGVCCDDGQECVDNQCMDPCEGTRCGGSLQLCCVDQEVCIFEGCHLPGDDCTNSFECPEDQYCEATLSQCLPRDAIDEECTYRPPVGEFTPAIKQHFAGVTHNGEVFSHSITTPLVADVTADGNAEIIALLYRGGLQEALIAVIDGSDGTLVAYGGVGQVRPNSAGIAVGQLDDATPELEIVGGMPGGGLIAFKYDPQAAELVEWWQNSEGALGDISYEMAPVIADLDADASPEVILGFSVVDAQGNIWNGLDEGPAGGQHGASANSTAIDLDGDGNLELIAGNRVMKLDGTMLWDRSGEVTDGYPAVGDFGNDGVPNIVNVSGGQVWVLDGLDGSTLFGPVAVPGGGQGGPPTVADFDGDGRVEFAAAGQGRYTVYDLDCQGDSPDPGECLSGRSDGTLWSVDVQDLSSSRTGSSVFDFEGDGRAEVVYNDECFLRVYDGQDGTVLYEQVNSTRTGSEYPIVADADGDFSAEIIVVSNNDQIARDGCEDNYANYPTGGTTGVFVYGDATNNWVPTRGIWNQHAYHITNVQDDGSIPARQPLHYTSSITNSFRLNVQPDGLFNAPDLVVEELGVRSMRCADEVTVVVEITVKNDGALGVGPGVEVEVRGIIGGNVEVIGTVVTTDRLLPGQTETLTIDWVVADDALDDGFELEATVDAADATNECLEDNNETTFARAGDQLNLDALVIREVDVRDTVCGATSTIDVTVTLANEGNATVPAGVPVVVEAIRNVNSETIQTVQSSELAPGATEDITLSWSVTSGFYGAEFEVRATIDPDQTTDTCSSGQSETSAAECIPSG